MLEVIDQRMRLAESPLLHIRFNEQLGLDRSHATADRQRGDTRRNPSTHEVKSPAIMPSSHSFYTRRL
jgi:hypothetical protein